jgi:hypothetical protein
MTAILTYSGIFLLAMKETRNLIHNIMFLARVSNPINKKKVNSVAVVRKRTIPTERPPLVGEVSANLCG